MILRLLLLLLLLNSNSVYSLQQEGINVRFLLRKTLAEHVQREPYNGDQKQPSPMRRFTVCPPDRFLALGSKYDRIKDQRAEGEREEDRCTMPE